jgi:hypothetical protein
MSTLRSFALLPFRLGKHRVLRGNWFKNYVVGARRKGRLPDDVPIDVIVCIVDHFEPTRRFGDAAAVESVRTWCEEYKRQIQGIHDSSGRPPQHTWFYRAEYPNLGCIRELSRYCYEGYGEIEFHLHHGYDTSESFRVKLEQGLDFFNRQGAMLTLEPSPRRRFAYIAGNWSLDNGSFDDSKSGCNAELAALREAGCYCDFTFPALGSKAQPRITNTIYYATDCRRPKSYDTGQEVCVGGAESGDLMIFQGPCGFDWHRGWFEDGAIESYSFVERTRMRSWLAPRIHVQGRPEWIFVKLHCHGMQSRELWCSSRIRELFEWMVADWNQGRFRLHFVNAREAYNIVKAAEQGESGNPVDYVDYNVPQPANRHIYCSSAWRLLEQSQHLLTFAPDPATNAQISVAGLDLDSIGGPIRQLELRREGIGFSHVKIRADSTVMVRRGNVKLPIEQWHQIDCCAPIK